MTTGAGWYTDRKGARYVHIPLGKGKRKSIRLACETDEHADARAKVVREIASVLIAAGHSTDAEEWARKAAAGDDERARRILGMARGLASGAERKTKGDALTGVTFKSIADDWTSGKLAKEYPDQVPVKRTVGDDIIRLTWLCGDGGLGDIPIAAFRIEHAEEAMRKLPERCRTPATRRHYAQTIRRVLELAVYPLRLIPANPLPRGFLPKPKQVRALQMPYPDEEAALLRCGRVDLAHRIAYGFLSRMGFRKSEATGSEPGEDEDPTPPLTWDRLDLDRGVVFMRRSKTEKARPLAMPPDVTRALAAWRNLRPNHVHVFADADDVALVLEARIFRAHLKLAGVKRDELHVKTADSLPVRVHDLRALFTTVSLAQGKSETWIRDRTAHKTLSMLDRYRRQARMFGELNLGPLAPLDEAIPELAPHVGPTSDEGKNGKDRKGADPIETPENLPILAATGTDAVLLSPLRLPIPPLRLVRPRF